MFKYLLIPITFLAPGAGFAAYMNSHRATSNLEKILKLEETYGGCNFWLVKNYEESTGWYPYEAVYSKELNRGHHSRLQKFIDQLEDNSESNTSTKSFKEECKSKKGKVVELVWDKNIWKKDSNDWTNKIHKTNRD